MASPRFATPRNPDRPTIGAGLADVARGLRRPLIPWQQDLADVSGELVQLEDGRWRPAYTVVIVVVPRRAGKTTVGLVRAVAECHRRPARAFFTADNEKKAMKIVREEWWPVLRSGGWDRSYKWRPRWSGIEAGLFREIRQANQWIRHSGITLFSPNPNALHGLDADLVMVDEVWAFDVTQGDALDAAIGPTAWARPWAQHWFLSAGGEPGSGWLHRKMDLGRAGAPGVCYVEFSADPDAADYDPYDPALWWQVHPGLGYLVDEDRIATDAQTMTLDQFERSLLCVWDRPVAEGARLANWETLLDPAAVPAGALIVAFDVPPSRASAAIAVADHQGAVELIEAGRRGTGWLAGRLAELCDRHPVAAIVRDPAGPAGATALPPGLNVVDVTALEVTEACGWLVDQIDNPARTLRIRQHPALATAIAGAQGWDVGDGRFRWARRKTSVDLSPLYAMNLAAWHASRTATPAIW